MKNKYKFLLFFGVFIFSIFFLIGNGIVRAEEDVPYGDAYDTYGGGVATGDAYDAYNDTDTNTGCSDGYYKGRDGNCYPSENLGTICPQGEYKGRDGQCYPNENQDITSCPSGEYKGRDGQCYPNENLTDQPDPNACSIDNDCTSKFGEGYKCDGSGTCMVDGFFSGTECKTNADCDRYYGPGFECSGVFVSTCERKPTSTVNTGSTQNGGSTPTQTVKTTQPVSLANGTVAPAGTTVNPVDGSAVSPTGQKYPPGSFQVPSGGVSNGIVMCANGILATECRDGNGNTIGGAPLTVINNPGSRSGNVAGVVTSPKCGTNFTDIGGVCFPTNTGLSSAPIYVILSNIFSWLMGLFTTLAVVAFVISGIQYLMASGDETLAKSAKNNANNAIIGIIVGLSGFIIIKAIAAALAGQGYFF